MKAKKNAFLRSTNQLKQKCCCGDEECGFKNALFCRAFPGLADQCGIHVKFDPKFSRYVKCNRTLVKPRLNLIHFVDWNGPYPVVTQNPASSLKSRTEVAAKCLMCVSVTIRKLALDAHPEWETTRRLRQQKRDVVKDLHALQQHLAMTRMKGAQDQDRVAMQAENY